MDIIDQVITTEATRLNVRRAIPILIYWATTEQTNRTYNDLIKALGYTRFSGICYVLGAIQEVINELSKKTGKPIPTLNSLCKKNKSKREDMLPSDGFDYVEPKYSSLTDEGKRTFVAGLDSIAIQYPNWDWVLSELSLTPYTPFSSTELNSILKTANYHTGGEGPEHKLLKEYILNHPEKIGVTDVEACEIEYLLPSGDKLDVYFKLADGSIVAVEVKSSISDDADITRGIFQAVKYKAILEAIQRVEGKSSDVSVLLVTGRTISDIHNRLITMLSVKHKQVEM